MGFDTFCINEAVLLVGILTSFETSPLELKGAVASEEKDSFKENKGDSF